METYQSEWNSGVAAIGLVQQCGIEPTNEDARKDLVKHLSSRIRQRRSDDGLIIVDEVGTPVRPEGTKEEFIADCMKAISGYVDANAAQFRRAPVADLSRPVARRLTAQERHAADLRKKSDGIKGNPWAAATRNLTNQARITLSDPDRAARLKREAGVAS